MTEEMQNKNSPESIMAEIIHNGGKKHEFLVKFPHKRYLMGTKNVKNTINIYQHTIQLHCVMFSVISNQNNGILLRPRPSK